MNRIELFYDIVSPYSWFAFETLCRYKKRWSIDLVLRPFFLNAVMRATENKPAGAFPAKLPYVQRDLIRNARYFDVPLMPPSDSVSLDTRRAMRLLALVSNENPEYLEVLTRSLWRLHWRDGRDTSEDHILRDALSDAALPAEQHDHLLENIGDPATKQLLRDATDEAVARGAFGSPTIFLHGRDSEEMFFGSDRFPLIAQCLGVAWEGPVPPNA